MVKFDELVGLEVNVACKILNDNGYNNVRIVMNSHVKLDDSNKLELVCAVYEENEEVVLVVGEFVTVS